MYLLNEETALIQTVDFFTPIADDPYIFGGIAAANALSDVYAMGGKPILALNIMAFPLNTLPYQVLADILRGGADKVVEAGAILVGGHSIQDEEPKYGLSVTGIAHPSEIWTNAGARIGDALILSKPLGIGIITTALRKRKDEEGNLILDRVVSPEVEKNAYDVMLELNAKAAKTAKLYPINSCTDITGFGLLGHAWEMATASKVAMELWTSKIPVIEGALELARQGYIAGGNYNNLEYLQDKVEFDPEVDTLERHILADPITSGGLLFALPKDKAEALVVALHQAGVVAAAIIGEVKAGLPGINVIVKRKQ